MKGAISRSKEGSRRVDFMWWAVFFLFFFCGGLASRDGFTQEKYPTKPINFLIGFPAGGTTDVCARPLVTAANKILDSPS